MALTKDDITDVCVDLETLATGPNPAVIEIGAVAFIEIPQNANGRWADRIGGIPSSETRTPKRSWMELEHRDGDFTFHRFVYPGDEQRATIETLQFWSNHMDQFRAILDGIMRTKEKNQHISLRLVAASFGDWLRSFPNLKRVWAHGSAFDIAILQNAHPDSKIWRYGSDDSWVERTFDHHMARDSRTLFDAYDYAPQYGSEVPHRALPDAIATALNIMAAYDQNAPSASLLREVVPSMTALAGSISLTMSDGKVRRFRLVEGEGS